MTVPNDPWEDLDIDDQVARGKVEDSYAEQFGWYRGGNRREGDHTAETIEDEDREDFDWRGDQYDDD